MTQFQEKLNQAGFTSYDAYLESPHWKYVRAAYRQSGRPHRCFVCDDKFYHLHHLTYRRLGHEYLDDLLPLCKEHHSALHAIMTDGMSKWNPQRILERLTTLPAPERMTRCAEFTNRGVSPKRRGFQGQYRQPLECKFEFESSPTMRPAIIQILNVKPIKSSPKVLGLIGQLEGLSDGELIGVGIVVDKMKRMRRKLRRKARVVATG